MRSYQELVSFIWNMTNQVYVYIVRRHEFFKSLTLRKFNKISNSGQSQVCAQDSRVSKFYIAIISSYSHMQRNDGKKYGLIKCRQDLGLEIKNLKNALCKHVNVYMIKAHKNRIIEPFWTCHFILLPKNVKF